MRYLSLVLVLIFSTVRADPLVEHSPAPQFTYDVRCVGNCGGTGGWREVIQNTVVTAGKTQLLDCQFAGSGCISTWYVMLKHTGTIAAGDTLASHAGWTEATPYSGNRPSISWSAASGNSKTASSAVSFSINATDTDVAGACIASAASGTSGTLYSCSNFGSVRSVVSGDTVTVTPTVTD
jgi:hypothetical protein